MSDPLKSGKAAGPEISNDLIKNFPQNWLMYVVVHFNKILEVERVPDSWGAVALSIAV